MSTLYDTAIVGGGIAGYSAALTAKNLKLNYLWLAAELFGETTQAAEYVRNYPSFTGNGRDFAAALDKQRRLEGVEPVLARVDGVYSAGGSFCLTAGSEEYRASTVILATGVERRASVKGEREFFGRGVSYCAVCDGALYRGKTVAAVLSSAKFAEEAEYLAGFAETVHCFCLYRGAAFGAKNIVVHEGAPDAIEGGTRVEKICKNGQTLSVSGVFFLKNAVPPRALCGGVETDGVHICTGRGQSTSLPGLYAAGDIAGMPYQYAKAAGEGLVAAYSARSYLAALRNKEGEKARV